MLTDTLLVVGAGIEQGLVINQAKEMGLRVVAIDGNPLAPCLKQADAHFVGDIRDPGFVVEAARKVGAKGLVCHAIDIPVTIAKAAEELGFPGYAPSVAFNASDKVKRLEILKKHNLNCADYKKIKSLDDLVFFWTQKKGESIILKPADNSGSRGVIRINNEAELEKSFKVSLSFTKNDYLIAESFLIGPELSSESVVIKGKAYTFALADRNYAHSNDFAPYFVEDGINYPSHFDSATLKKTNTFIQDVVTALELDNGVAKGDLLIQGGEPYLIEMAPRSSGGWFGAGSMKFATGVDYISILIKQGLNLPIHPSELEPKFSKPCAQRYWIPRVSGVVESVDFPEDLAKMPNVEMLELFLPKVGQRIKKAQNHSDRFAQVICTGVTLDQAVKSCEEVIKAIRINIKEES